MQPTKFTYTATYRCLEHLRKNSVDLYLCYCGMEQCEPSHCYGPHIRNEYLIHVVLSGKGRYTIGNKTYELGPGSCFLINPGEVTYYEATSDDPWHYIWVGFDGLKAESVIRYLGLVNGNLTGQVSDTAPYLEAVQGMIDARQPTLPNDFIRESHLCRFISLLMEDLAGDRRDEPVQDKTYLPYVESAVEYIQKNYKTNVRIQEIADRIGVNRSYLTKCFTQVMSISPQQYLLEYRMKKASSLLHGTNMQVKDIALEVGFSDPLAFSKAFKNLYHTSPTEHRDIARQMENSTVIVPAPEGNILPSDVTKRHNTDRF